MRTRAAVFVLSFALGLAAASPAALAESDAIKRMAEIVMNIDHRPSSGDRDALRGIASDESSTPAERAIANALLQMDHQVSRGDRDKLREVVNDGAASEAEKELADVVMGLNHRASSRDRERLGQL